MSYVFKPKSYKNETSPVDLASFRPDAELVRSMKFNPSGAISTEPLYDFKDGVDNGKVSDIMLALRSGKLDKAEIAAIQRALVQQGVQNVDAKNKDAVEKATLAVASRENKRNNKTKSATTGK